MLILNSFLESRDSLVFSELFFFSSRRRHTRLVSDWSSDVCSSDLHFAVRRPWLTAFVAATYERRGRFSSASDTDRMSGNGPKAKSTDVAHTSAFRGKADSLCSLSVLLVMTQNGTRPRSRTGAKFKNFASVGKSAYQRFIGIFGRWADASGPVGVGSLSPSP